MRSAGQQHVRQTGAAPAERRAGSAYVDARGALLLEVLLSLAIFISAGLMVLTTMGRGVSELEAARLRVVGTDLARSAIAEIEAGVSSAESLNGPVPEWREDGAVFDDALPEETGWELRVETSPTRFDGLTLVTVTAVRIADGGSAGGAGDVGGVTLQQMVRIGEGARDQVGDEDDISAEAARDSAGRDRFPRESGSSRDERGGGP